MHLYILASIIMFRYSIYIDKGNPSKLTIWILCFSSYCLDKIKWISSWAFVILTTSSYVLKGGGGYQFCFAGRRRLLHSWFTLNDPSQQPLVSTHRDWNGSASIHLICTSLVWCVYWNMYFNGQFKNKIDFWADARLIGGTPTSCIQ